MPDSSSLSEGALTMGVRVRKKGNKWGVFITHKGKRKALIRWEIRKEAEAVAVRIRKDLSLADLGLGDKEKQVPFDTYSRRWLATYAVEECKRSTVRNSYRPSLETHLIPHFGSKCLTDFTPLDIRGYVEKKRGEGLNIKTVRNHLVPLRVIFFQAIEDGIIRENPVSQVRLGRRKRTKEQKAHSTLTIEELARLLETIGEHYPVWQPFFYTLAHAGMRLGEALGLKWGDLNVGEGPETTGASFTSSGLSWGATSQHPRQARTAGLTFQST
jgi:integrase